MGIRGLETYIREYDKEISHKIDIREAIADWKQDHDGISPTIIVNLKSFVRILANIDDDSLIKGGQYDLYNQTVEYFFKELELLGVNLVFFCRPFLHDIEERVIYDAYDHVVKNDLDCFRKIQAKQGQIFPWHFDKRFLYNLTRIAAKYGTVKTENAKFTRTIVKYAVDHSDEVLAIIACDTDFLLFDDTKYQYWSLSHLDILKLTTKIYCRDILYQKLRMSTQQSQLLAAISRLKGDTSFWKLAEYVRGKTIGPNGIDVIEVAKDIFGDSFTEEEKNQIEHELSRYDRSIKIELNDTSSELVKFCKKNLYFAYGLLIENLTTNQSLAYIDFRSDGSAQYVQEIITVYLKLCGVLLKDHEKPPEIRQIKIKRNLENEAVPVDENIIYPEENIIVGIVTIKNLIIPENDDNFSESRWRLFEWLLDSDMDIKLIANIRTLCNEKYFRIVLFTIEFLLKHKLISSREAGSILLSERNSRKGGNTPVNGNASPKKPVINWREPTNVERSWIQTAHKYTIAFELICHCLEVCGLRCQTDLIRFDESEFHKIMRKPEQNDVEIEKNLREMKSMGLGLSN